MKNIVIAKILQSKKLSKKLSVYTVDIGTKQIQIVSGAPNAIVNIFTVVALPSATLTNLTGETLTITEKTFLGEKSEGVFCSGKELSINENHSGILELDQYYNIGDEFDANKISQNPRWMKYINISKVNTPQMDVLVDEVKIEDVLTRGIKEILPSYKLLKKQMMNGKRIRIYTGIDPTANFIHMGHYIWMKKLAKFQELGHEVIFLIGGFTAMIGDPDKKYSREPLTKEKVWENFQSYKKTASKILNFDWQSNPITILNNYDWLSKITLEDWLQIMGSVTMQHMLSHDMFKTRLKEQKPIRLNEMNYPLMQGFDGVAMEVDVELGGSDQTFNMLTGRILSKELINKEKQVITLKLLTDNSGKKMGKTTGNAISSKDSANDIYGKIMSWSDNMIFQGFESLTDFDLIKYSEKNISTNPMKYKKELAYDIVKTIYDIDTATKAEQHFIDTVQNQSIPDDIKTISLVNLINKIKNTDILLKNLLTLTNLTSSNSDAKRLIKSGAVEIDEIKITDPNKLIHIKNISLIKAGKRNWIKIIN